MRIVAGEWRGRTIAAPAGTSTRPTSDRVREAVFSAARSRVGDLSGLRVLDAFAGSGALAFEALSRGAEFALLVEPDRAARDAITKNANALGAEGRAAVMAGDVFRMAERAMQGGPFSLLFLDPPYRIVPAQVSRLLEDLSNNGMLTENALVVYEHSSHTSAEWPIGFDPQGDRRYGSTKVSYATFEGKRPT